MEAESHKQTQTEDFGVYGVRSDLIGRDRETVRLDELMADAVEEKKPISVVVVGNQGVGKSRLVSDWLHMQKVRRKENLRVLRTWAQNDDTTHQMWTRLLRTRFALTEGEHEDTVRQKLREEVTRVFAERRMTEILHFLGTFLGVGFPDNPFLQAIEEHPSQHIAIARTVLRRFFETDANVNGPTVVLFEDLHHADESSLELLSHLAASEADAPLLIVGVGRSEVIGKWPLHDGKKALEGWEKIELGSLDEQQARQLLQGVLKRLDEVPEEFITEAVEMTGGNPYFLEQLVRLLISQEIITVGEQKWTLDWQRFQETDLPLSVEEAVQARVAALSPSERLLLEMAATMGNVFWFGGLLVLSRLEEGIKGSEALWKSTAPIEKLKQTVEKLVEHEYLMKMPDSWVERDQEFVFKHNLEYKTIKESTNPQKVKAWHHLVAQWLESRLQQRNEEQLDTLGQHYKAGANHRRAAYCFVRAGDQARSRFANEQAMRFYKTGLELLDPSESLSRIDALHNLGDVCALVGRTNEALQYFEEMLHHAYLLDNGNKGGAALGRIARIYRTIGEYDKAMRHYETAQRLFLRASDRRGVAATLDDMGKVMWLKGDYENSLRLHQQALEIRKELGDDRSTAFTLGNIGVVYQDSGQFKDALECFQKSMELREKVGDRQGMVHAATHVGSVWQNLGEIERAMKIWQEALKEARALGDRLQQAYLLANIGELQRRQQETSQALDHLQTAAEIAEALGDRRLLGECHRKLGELATDEQNWEEAKKHLRLALELAQSAGNKAQAGSAHRSMARLSFLRKIYPEAEREFEKSMEIFSKLGHHLEVARTCEDMAEFYLEMGENEKANRLQESARSIRANLEGAARQPGARNEDGSDSSAEIAENAPAAFEVELEEIDEEKSDSSVEKPTEHGSKTAPSNAQEPDRKAENNNAE